MENVTESIAEMVARRSYGKHVAFLAASARDVAAAEDALSEAFVSALIDDQDASLWDWRMIVEAEGLLRRASALGSIGRYQLEGALQSAHIYRRCAGQDNCWPGQASMTKPAEPMRSRSVSSATLRSAAFCSGVRRPYQAT